MPKWNNKGHEFDELGNFFKANNNIVLIGNYEECIHIKNKLGFLKVPVEIETDFIFEENGKSLGAINKLFAKIKNKKILNERYFQKVDGARAGVLVKKEKDGEGSGKIIIFTDSCSSKNLRFFKNLGYKENKNLFKHFEFFERYLPVFAVYVADQVYSPTQCFICTTKCTLNCKDCLNYAPFDRNKQHFDINRLKQDLDIYFKCIDRCGFFHLSGGEPFSYPHFCELIEYIHTNYKDKIETLATVTNMTVMPGDELCTILRNCKVLVQCDNYTETNPKFKRQYQRVLDKLKANEINIETIEAGKPWHWVRTFPPKQVHLDEKILQAKYDACGSVFQELKNGKIFGCCYCEFISQAGVFPYQPHDFYDLTQFTFGKKKEFVEFRLKYTEKGYVEFCKYCNGLPPCNSEYITPAIQAKGLFEWDKNNPTVIKITERN